jgi:hypothetical protein
MEMIRRVLLGDWLIKDIWATYLSEGLLTLLVSGGALSKVRALEPLVAVGRLPVILSL